MNARQMAKARRAELTAERQGREAPTAVWNYGPAAAPAVDEDALDRSRVVLNTAVFGVWGFAWSRLVPRKGRAA